MVLLSLKALRVQEDLLVGTDLLDYQESRDQRETRVLWDHKVRDRIGEHLENLHIFYYAMSDSDNPG